MARKIAAIVMILLAAALFAAGGKDDSSASPGMEMTPSDPRLFQPGKLTVATGEPVYPPWMLDDNPAGGEGFENGLVYALAEELGFAREDVIWVRQTFDQGIAPGAKPYDFNIQQYSVKEERREFVDFSMVYYKPEKALVALSDSKVSNATSFADLRKLRWGATIGTVDLDYIETILGVENPAVYNDQSATFQAMLANQIDATLIGLPTALYVTAVQVPEASIAAILPHDPNDLGHGLVFEKGNPLVPWINKGLEAIISKGIIADLTAKYLIGDDTIPEISR
ncbi:MAG: amino acid ABC transporter substrate-binding protein [Spirochaeta sp. LUC14_002_19_P3]|nr:MAG: amino acid ABC transporter substrate-binding protein [Spirochaeta sp. LUC14_002_19_P3]